MRSHTVSAEGGAAAVVRTENDNLDLHAYDTIKGSDFISDQDAVEAFVKEAPLELLQLEHWGCPWSRDPDGRVATRTFGGMSTPRTLFAADKTGFHMLHALFQTSLKYDRIVRYDELFVTSLIVHDGAVRGITAIDLHSGKLRPIYGRAVIICTGGAGRVFPFTTNAAIKTGDGMAMAYRAGVSLKDMEFVQYHPTGLSGHRHPHHGSFARRGRLPLQQGWGQVPQKLRADEDGARPAGSPLAGDHRGDGGGTRIRGEVRPVRAPRSHAPRREEDRRAAPLRARSWPRSMSASIQ